MRNFTRQARWLALALILMLGLTACFQAAGSDLPPTPQGQAQIPPVQGTPTATLLVQPTATPDGSPTVETATDLPGMGTVTETPGMAGPTDFPTLGGPTATPTMDVMQSSGPTATRTIAAVPLATQTSQATFTQQFTFTPQATFTQQFTFTPQATFTLQFTYTPQPTLAAQVTQTPLPTYTALPTYTPLPTYTMPAAQPPQVITQSVPMGQTPGSGIIPSLTFTPVPRFPTFTPTATFTPYAPGVVVPDSNPLVVDVPVEAVPLGERVGIGGAFDPTPLSGESPVLYAPDDSARVAQIFTPTMSSGQLTATQIVYEATATAAYLLGSPPPPTPIPPGMPTAYPTQPGQVYVQPTAIPYQQQVIPGSFPPNATVVTATPYGMPGVCHEHLIQPDETLYRIALTYGVTAAAISTQNGIVNADLIQAGDTLLIPCPLPPSATPTVSPPVVQGTGTDGQGGQAATSQQIYTVQAGDNIYQISLRFGVDMSELVAVNGLNAVTMQMIYVGQQLIIPGQVVTITATPAVVQPQVYPTLTPYIIVVTSSP